MRPSSGRRFDALAGQLTRRYSETCSVTISARCSGSRQRVEPLVVDRVAPAGDHPDRAGLGRTIQPGFLDSFPLQPVLERLERGALVRFVCLDLSLSLLVVAQRRLRRLVGDRFGLILVVLIRLRGRLAGLAEVEVGAAPALPIRCGKIAFGQRFGVGAAGLVMFRQGRQPAAGRVPGAFGAGGRDHFVVPLPRAGVERRDHDVADLAVETQGVAGRLRDRLRVAALGAQRPPALERFGPARFDLDHDLVVWLGRFLRAEQELLDGGGRSALGRKEAGRVGMAGDREPVRDLDRDRLRLVAIGG